MSDEPLTTVAAFNTPHEAALARNRLEEEGITAYVVDAETVGMIWHVGGALGGVKVQVGESDVPRARAVLGSASRRRGADSPDDYGLAERVQAGPRLRLAEAEPEEPEEEPEPESDAIALRAWRSAIIGLLLLPPLLHFYSCWLLFQLPFSNGPLSPSGRSKSVAAAVVNVLVFFGVILLLRSLVSPAPPDPFQPPPRPHVPFPQFP